MNHYEKYKVDIPIGKSGEWKVEKFKVEEDDVKRQEIRASFHPGEWHRVVPVGEYTRLMCKDVLVMSDTPAEIMDHLDVIREALALYRIRIVRENSTGCLLYVNGRRVYVKLNTNQT